MWPTSPWRPGDASRKLPRANSHTHDIVAKLWNLCNVLKDDGVTYHQYVSELTYLLFLKMAQETGHEQGIPEEWRWSALETLQGVKQLEHYKLMLLELGASGSGASAIVLNGCGAVAEYRRDLRSLSCVQGVPGVYGSGCLPALGPPRASRYLGFSLR